MFLFPNWIVVAIVGSWSHIWTNYWTIKSGFLTTHITFFIFIILRFFEGTSHWVIIAWSYQCFIVLLMSESLNFWWKIMSIYQLEIKYFFIFFSLHRTQLNTMNYLTYCHFFQKVHRFLGLLVWLFWKIENHRNLFWFLGISFFSFLEHLLCRNPDPAILT